MAFIAAPRAAWVCVHDKADPIRRLFLRQKLNIASQTTGLAYRIVPSAGDPEVPVVQWDAEPVTTTADEALADETGAGRGGDRGARVGEAVAWLKDLLANGPLPQGTIEAAAKKGDLKWRTVQRAKSRLAVVSRNQESGWEWSLQETDDEGDQTQVQGCQDPATGNVGGVGTLGVLDASTAAPDERTKAAKTAKHAKSAKKGQVGNVGGV